MQTTVTSYPQSKQGQHEGTQLLLLGHTQFCFSGEFMTHCGLGLPASINLAKTVAIDMRTNKPSVENSTSRPFSRWFYVCQCGWTFRVSIQSTSTEGKANHHLSFLLILICFFFFFVLDRAVSGVRQRGREPLKT